MSNDRFDRLPIGFKIWFAFCGLLGLAFAGFVVWLIVAAIDYLGRH